MIRSTRHYGAKDEFVQLRAGKRVLEIGCGGGYYTSDAARFVGQTGRVCAINGVQAS